MSDNDTTNQAPASADPALDGRPDEKVGLINADEPIRQEGMNWFVLRVASNKESSVRDTLLRKVQIERMTHLVNRILVPTPMKDHEIEKMLKDSKKPEDTPNVRMVFEKGEHVIIKEGPFTSYEGTVDELLPDKGLVRVLVTIFGRQAPIELEEWQIGKAEGA